MIAEGAGRPVAAEQAPSPVLLQLENLAVDYLTPEGPLPAVRGLNFSLARGEVVGLAGESGSGKSTVAMAVTRLLAPNAATVSGRVLFDGRDVLTMEAEQFRRLRWARMAIVFQGAMNSLNPVTTIRRQIVDALWAHGERDRGAIAERARALMDLVQIDPAVLDRYPHELSGGMRQRAVIAIAMAFRPDLLIMDEPTTALDVVVQRQILVELLELQSRLHFAILFITHDVSLLLEICDRIAIMYAGSLVEVAPVEAVATDPWHPYTAGLLRSFPGIHQTGERLTGIPGAPPALTAVPRGCAFHPRCPWAIARCQTDVPILRPLGDNRWAACHRAEEVEWRA